MIIICLVILVLLILFGMFYYFLYIKKDFPFLGILDAEWSIGLMKFFNENNQFNLSDIPSVSNPVIRAEDINIKDIQFVADPFIRKYQDKYQIFFEIMRSEKGEIGLSESTDLINWNFSGIVLSEKFHLSYPFIFEFKNNIYMTPESSMKNEIRIYVAEEYPYKWQYHSTLLKGKEWFDNSVLNWKGMWYLFTNLNNDTLEVYYSDNPLSDWKPHKLNPIITNNKKISRPAGSFFISNNRLFRFAQDGSERYGSSVRMIEIQTLTPEEYSEAEISTEPILKATGKGWNSIGMHHISILEEGNTFIAAVDGNGLMEQPVIFFYNKRIKISRWMFNTISKIKRGF